MEGVGGHLQQTPLTWSSRKAQNSMRKILEQNKRGRTSLLSRKDARTKVLSWRLSVVLWGMALPTHTRMGRCSKAFLWRLALLPATQLPYVTFSSELESLHWSVCTEMPTPGLKGWFNCLRWDFLCCLRCYRKSETPTRRWQMQHRTSQYSTSRPEITCWSIQFGTQHCQQPGHNQGYLTSQYTQGILGNNLVCQELDS